MVPEGWKQVTYGDVCAINRANLPPSTPPEQQLTYLDIGSVPELGVIAEPLERYRFAEAPSRARRIVEAGDVVVSTVRPYLQAFARPTNPAPDLVASTGFAVLTPRNAIMSEFLFQTVCSRPFMAQLEARMVGSSYPAVNNSDVSNATLLLPPLPEQRKITAILSSVDDTIVATRKVIEQTKRVKQGLLQTLTTRGIGHSRFKATEIGEIPEAWELVPLGDVCAHITKGATPTTYGYQWIEGGDDGVLFLRSECVSDAGFQLSGSERIPESAHASMSRSEIRGGDVLVTITGNVGRVGQVPEEIERANINQHLARIRVEARELSQDFVHLALQTKGQRNRFETIVTGLAYPQLSLKQIRETVVPVPPRAEQEEIVERIWAIQDVLGRSQRSLAAWQNMKRGLMQDLLTGRVRVQPD